VVPALASPDGSWGSQRVRQLDSCALPTHEPELLELTCWTAPAGVDLLDL